VGGHLFSSMNESHMPSLILGSELVWHRGLRNFIVKENGDNGIVSIARNSDRCRYAWLHFKWSSVFSTTSCYRGSKQDQE